MRQLTLYTRPMCILCAQVKEQLVKASVPFKAQELATPEEQEAVIKRHRARSFPLLVLDGTYLGGFTHVVQLLSSGKLQSLLSEG